MTLEAMYRFLIEGQKRPLDSDEMQMRPFVLSVGSYRTTDYSLSLLIMAQKPGHITHQ
jgi:hypothetical protein